MIVRTRRTVSGTVAGLRPLRVDAQRNYDKILGAATQVFAEQGAQASLDHIATVAGVGPGTLYRHFPTRNDLIAAAIETTWRDLIVHGEQLHDAPDALGALREWLLALAQHAGTYGGLAECIAPAFAGAETPFQPTCDSSIAVTESLLARAKASGQIRDSVTASDLVVISNSLAWAADRNGATAADLPRLLDLLVMGLS
jgi:AcrR family transcriptional regulator